MGDDMFDIDDLDDFLMGLIDEFRSTLKELRKDLYTNPKTRKVAGIFLSLTAHAWVFSANWAIPEFKCPKCGKRELGWTCCNISLDDSIGLTNKKLEELMEKDQKKDGA